MDRSEFQDANYWTILHAKHLGRYDPPKWTEPCTPEKMDLWLDRLDITPVANMRATNTSHEDFIKLNPAWPLAAWLGLMLEHVDA